MGVIQDSRAFFAHIRALLNSGAITYEKAKEMATPSIDEMNARGKEIAKEHGKKFRPFTFTGVIR